MKVKCQKVEILRLKREAEACQHVARLEVTVSFACQLDTHRKREPQLAIVSIGQAYEHV